MALKIWLRTAKMRKKNPNLLLPLIGIFLIWQHGTVYRYHHIDRIAHTMAFVTMIWCGALAEIRNSSFGSPGGIDLMTLCTKSRCCTNELCPIPKYDISISH